MIFSNKLIPTQVHLRLYQINAAQTIILSLYYRKNKNTFHKQK